MKSPVSVIIPCYCCASTIERAVRSVAEQTVYPIEVCLIDDASPDDGATLAKLYALQDEYSGVLNIQVIALRENGGPGTARNAGWNAAMQPYVAFLDADDSWHPGKLEIQYGWMASHPNVDVCGHLCVREGIHRPTDSLSLDEFAVHNVSKRGLLMRNAFVTSSIMLKRSLPLRFEKGKRHAEDYYLWLQALCSGYHAVRLEIPLVFQYKAPFGAGGLSGDLWPMERGVQTALRRLQCEGCLNPLECWLAQGFSFLKYVRRAMLAQCRNRSTGGEGSS